MTYFDKKPSFSRKNTPFHSTGITAAQIPVFGIDLNTGIPVLGIGIAIPNYTVKIKDLLSVACSLYD